MVALARTSGLLSHGVSSVVVSGSFHVPVLYPVLNDSDEVACSHC